MTLRYGYTHPKKPRIIAVAGMEQSPCRLLIDGDAPDTSDFCRLAEEITIPRTLWMSVWNLEV